MNVMLCVQSVGRFGNRNTHIHTLRGGHDKSADSTAAAFHIIQVQQTTADTFVSFLSHSPHRPLVDSSGCRLDGGVFASAISRETIAVFGRGFWARRVFDELPCDILGHCCGTNPVQPTALHLPACFREFLVAGFSSLVLFLLCDDERVFIVVGGGIVGVG